jgi:hypothetical protein
LRQASQLASEVAIVNFHSDDDRLKQADLRKIATALDITVPSSYKKSEDTIAHIARSLIAFGLRPEHVAPLRSHVQEAPRFPAGV